MKRLIQTLSLCTLALCSTFVLPIGLFSIPGRFAKIAYWGLTAGIPIGAGIYYSDTFKSTQKKPLLALYRNKEQKTAHFEINYGNPKKWEFNKNDFPTAAASTIIPFGLHLLSKKIAPKFTAHPYLRLPFGLANAAIGFGTVYAMSNYNIAKKEDKK